MTEVHVVRHDNSHLYAAKLEQYFKGRYDVFVRERGWKELERPDGRDIDQFDTEEAIHLLAIDKHHVIGGLRINPSTEPTLLSEVFPHLCSVPLTKSPDIYEVTRMWVVKERRNELSRPTVEALLTVASLESVPKLQQGLQSFRNMRRMEASFKNARALQLRFSQSLARRRQRLSHAIVRSTIQRLGNCTNPFAWSDRLTISVSRRGRNLASALAKIGPWYALSANSFSRNGN